MRTQKHTREILARLGQDWIMERIAGSGHIVLRHKDGARATVPGSPSCPRTVLNTLSDARKAVAQARQRKEMGQ